MLQWTKHSGTSCGKAFTKDFFGLCSLFEFTFSGQFIRVRQLFKDKETHVAKSVPQAQILKMSSSAIFIN